MSLQLHLKRLLGSDLDVEVYDYIEGVIREYDGSGLSIEDVRDTLCGFSEVLAQLPEQEQDAAVESLLRDAQTSLRGGANQTQVDVAPSTKGAINIEAQANIGAVEARPIKLSNQRQEQQQPPPPSIAFADQCRDEVTLLASLCPISVPEDYLADLFTNKSHRNLQTAANRILEQGPEVLQAEVIAWEAAAVTGDSTTIENLNTSGPSGRDKQRIMTGNSPLKPDEELRRSIVARFHLEAIPTSGGGGGGNGKGVKGTKLVAWGTQNSGNGSQNNNGTQKLRYRDGVVVATKGEKFIVEKEPEWDGGSRGRVKSKRKGGVGWQ